MKRSLICVAVLALLLVPALASATLITTTNAGGNNNGGAMFDLTDISAGPITLTGLFKGVFGGGAFSTDPVTSGTVEVYYRIGSYTDSGAQSSLAGWTLLGSAAVSSTGDNTPISFDVANSLALASGETIGMFVYLDSSTLGGVKVTNASGPTTYSDAFVQLALGVSIGDTGSTPLNGAGVFGNRIWNGSIDYQAGALPVPLPGAVWLLGSGLLGLLGLRRRKVSQA